MNLNITILLILSIANFSLAQNHTLADSALIRKNKIKTAKSISLPKNELDEIWEFDKNGLLISNEQMWTENTTKMIDLFFYKDHLLVEKWDIGLWAQTGTVDSIAFDTVRTIYTYNNKNQLLTQTGEMCLLSYNNIYNNGLLTNREYHVKKDCDNKGKDTLIYNTQKQLIKKMNYGTDECYTFSYDLKGRRISEMKSSISDTTKIYYIYNHHYEKDKLKKAVNITYRTEKNVLEAHYTYNKNGMVKKLTLLHNYGETNFKNRYKFVYTYY